MAWQGAFSEATDALVYSEDNKYVRVWVKFGMTDGTSHALNAELISMGMRNSAIAAAQSALSRIFLNQSHVRLVVLRWRKERSSARNAVCSARLKHRKVKARKDKRHLRSKVKRHLQVKEHQAMELGPERWQWDLSLAPGQALPRHQRKFNIKGPQPLLLGKHRSSRNRVIGQRVIHQAKAKITVSERCPLLDPAMFSITLDVWPESSLSWPLFHGNRYVS